MSQVKYLKFLLDKTCFSIKIDYVEEIIHLPQITKVPLSEDFIIGISNLRGEIAPIVDLKKRIKGNYIELNDLSRVIVVNLGGEKTGLLIESISSIEEVEGEKITSADKFEGISSKFLEGIYETPKGDLVGIVNLKEIILFESRGKELKQEKTAFEDKEVEDKSVERYGKKILTFRVRGQIFAVEIDFSREIIEKPKIEEIPTKSKDIIGVFNLREEIIPVVDLRRKLEIEDDTQQDDEHIDKIIVFTYYGSIIGLLVNEVEEVLDPLKSEIMPVPNTFDDFSKRFVKAIYHTERSGEIVFVLDEKSILTEEEIEDIDKFKKESEDKAVIMEREEAKIAVFNIGEEEFGFPIEKINEINRLPEITSVPKSAKFIEGIINLRGEIIPVVNLRERLGFERKELDEDELERVIIVEIGGQKTGLMVDRVKEIKAIDNSMFKEVPQFLKTSVERDVIERIVNVESEGRIITILSVDNILTKEEKRELKINKDLKKDVKKQPKEEQKEIIEKEKKENSVKKEVSEAKKKKTVNKKKERTKTQKKGGGRKKKLIKAK